MCILDLKRVTADMQTHKNPTLRQGPAPFKAPSSTGDFKSLAPVDKPPSFVRDGKKWLIVSSLRSKKFRCMVKIVFLN